MNFRFISILCVAIPVLLSGCSGAPSESAIKEAIVRQQAEQQKQMSTVGQMFGNGEMARKMAESMKVTVKSAHKVGCKEDSENAYLCDVEIEVERAGHTAKSITSARFVKGSDGWSVGS